MEWTEVKIYTTTEGIEPVTASLLESGVTGVMVEDDKELKQYLSEGSMYWDYVDDELLNKPEGETKVIAYVSDNPYGMEMLSAIKTEIERLKTLDIGLDLGRLEIETVSDLDDEVWLNKWKDYYKPFTVGNKIFIKPVWEDVKAPEGRVTFNINPGHAFGTGLHQTTQLCMLELEKYVNKDSAVADFGCGSGILSVVSLLLGAKEAFAVDIDDNVVKTAYENAELSGVNDGRYYVTQGNIVTDEKLREKIGFGKYDIVVANIIADVICAISPYAVKALKREGVFIASGIIKDRVEDVNKALADAGFEVINTAVKDEWVCITSRIK